MADLSRGMVSSIHGSANNGGYSQREFYTSYLELENFDLNPMSEMVDNYSFRKLETPPTLLFAIGLSEDFRSDEVRLFSGDYDNISIYDSMNYSHNKFLTTINHCSLENRFNTDIIVGSCNGLVCLAIPYYATEDPVYICNPATGEHVHLPNTTNREGFTASGFGYHPLADVYKVVRIFFKNDFNQLGQVEVYTLGDGNGWRRKADIPHSLSFKSGVHVDGALYWLDCERKEIVAFDLADEEFRVISSPPCFRSSNSNCSYRLQLLGGCLCVVQYEAGKTSFDVWSLKKEKIKKFSWDDIKEETWTREFFVVGDYIGKSHIPFALTKSSEVLLWDYHRKIVSIYDPKTEALKQLRDNGMRIQFFQAVPHKDTSISLEALGEKSDKEMVKIIKRDSFYEEASDFLKRKKELKRHQPQWQFPLLQHVILVFILFFVFVFSLLWQ